MELYRVALFCGGKPMVSFGVQGNQLAEFVLNAFKALVDCDTISYWKETRGNFKAFTVFRSTV